MFQVVQIHTRPTPPDAYAPIAAPQGKISPIATGLAGLGAGALIGIHNPWDAVTYHIFVEKHDRK